MIVIEIGKIMVKNASHVSSGPELHLIFAVSAAPEHGGTQNDPIGAPHNAPPTLLHGPSVTDNDHDPFMIQFRPPGTGTPQVASQVGFCAAVNSRQMDIENIYEQDPPAFCAVTPDTDIVRRVEHSKSKP